LTLGRLTVPNRSVRTLVSAPQKRYDYYMKDTSPPSSNLERHFIEQADRTLQLLKELPTEADEENHVEADAILVDFVRELGFTEIAEAYENIGKWYA
jgi:hypothetical protein